MGVCVEPDRDPGRVRNIYDRGGGPYGRQRNGPIWDEQKILNRDYRRGGPSEGTIGLSKAVPNPQEGGLS